MVAMLVAVVTWSLLALGLYLSIGLVFSVPLLTRWVGDLDPDAADGSWGFKVLVFPGCVALWPLLALRLRSGAAGLPAERTPHRRAAGDRSDSLDVRAP